MKTRILSGVGVVVFLIAMLLCTYTPFFSLFLALLSGVAVFEIERVAQVKNKAIMGISVAFSALLPVLISQGSICLCRWWRLAIRYCCSF
ncbi:MAG: hypothetical protein ACLTB5_13710 [Acutalibacteraceae bacterium]